MLREWCLSVTRHDGAAWDEPVEIRGTSKSEFWDSVHKLSRRRRRPWIVSAACEQDWTLLGGWEELDAGRIDFGSIQPLRVGGEIVERERGESDRCAMVLGSNVTILHHRIDDSFLTWIDTRNYCDSTLQELADCIGYDRPAMEDPNSTRVAFAHDVSRASRILREWYVRLIRAWRSEKRGPWRTTAAQLAHAYWRSSHYTHPILVHGERVADKIERAALFGGRASVWYAGDIGKPVRESGDDRVYPPSSSHRLTPGFAIHIDVRSMYPWLLRERPFPIRLARVRGEMPVAELAEVMETRAVIAKVRVRTDRGEYPLRMSDDGCRSGSEPVSLQSPDAAGGRGRVIYPAGHWVGCYAGPELAEMIRRGEVEKVEMVCEYEQGPAFRSFASAVLDDRIARRRVGDAVGESMAKLLANAFAGKFAARGGGWRTDPKIIPQQYWGPWSEIDAQTGKSRKYRAFGGVAQEWHERSDDPTGVPSIFAYLTAYGRVFMAALRAALPPRSVYHQDTDGIWCHPDCEGILREAGYVFGDAPGNLRIDYTSSYLRFLTPKHYCVDGDWIVSGITPDGQPLLNLQWIDTVQRRPSAMITDGPVADVVHVERPIELSLLSPEGRIDRAGWVSPPNYPPLPWLHAESDAADHSPDLFAD